MSKLPGRVSALPFTVSYGTAADSPGGGTCLQIDLLMDSLGYDRGMFPPITNAVHGAGNYIAEQVILYGIGTAQTKAGEYANLYYEPVDPPMFVEAPGSRQSST